MEKSKKALQNLERSVEAALNHFNKHKTIHPRYLIDVVGRQLAEALTNFFPEIEERHKIKPVKDAEETITVVHYTSIATVFSMLEKASNGDKNNSLRLSDSAHFNDPDEGNYIVNNVPEKHAWLGLKEKDTTHAYIASFIYNPKEKMDNNLVFWRTYGKEGEGCSLSIPIPRSRLKRVLYGADQVKLTIESLCTVLDFLNPLLEIKEESLRKDIMPTLAEIVWKPLEKFRYLYKSKDYEYESEYRLVLDESYVRNKGKSIFELQNQNNSPVHIRHYYIDEDLAVEKLLVSGSSMTLGPCVANRHNVLYCLKELIERGKEKFEGFSTEIKLSEISYQKF